MGRWRVVVRATWWTRGAEIRHRRSGRRGAHQSAVAESAIAAHVRPAPSPLGLLLDGRLTVAVRCPGEKRATAGSHRSRRVAWIAAQRWPWSRQNGPAAHGRRPASRCRRTSAGATQRGARTSERATRRAEGNTREVHHGSAVVEHSVSATCVCAGRGGRAESWRLGRCEVAPVNKERETVPSARWSVRRDGAAWNRERRGWDGWLGCVGSVGGDRSVYGGCKV